jgi:toxin ParE1/3/4
MRIHFRPEAAGDLTEAYRWYERQRRGLGGEFEAAVEETLSLLKQAPAAFPILHRELRRILLDRFPYAIYYRLTQDEIEIRACLHTRRHPSRWRRRA